MVSYVFCLVEFVGVESLKVSGEGGVAREFVGEKRYDGEDGNKEEKGVTTGSNDGGEGGRPPDRHGLASRRRSEKREEEARTRRGLRICHPSRLVGSRGFPVF